MAYSRKRLDMGCFPVDPMICIFGRHMVCQLLFSIPRHPQKSISLSILSFGKRFSQRIPDDIPFQRGRRLRANCYLESIERGIYSAGLPLSFDSNHPFRDLPWNRLLCS